MYLIMSYKKVKSKTIFFQLDYRCSEFLQNILSSDNFTTYLSFRTSVACVDFALISFFPVPVAPPGTPSLWSARSVILLILPLN